MSSSAGRVHEGVSGSPNAAASPGRAPRIDKDARISTRVRRGSKELLGSVTHVPRISLLDRNNLASSHDPFRGFYTLFWIIVALLVLNAFLISLQSSGQLLSLTFAALMGRDACILALSDAALVSSTFLCVALVKAMHRFGIGYGYPVAILQAVWYLTLLGAVIVWSRVRAWPWVQSGFFVLHSMVMIMKIHSYVTMNGLMLDTFERLTSAEAALVERVCTLYKAGPDAQSTDRAWADAVRDIALSFTQMPRVRDVETAVFAEWAALPMQTGSSRVRAQVLFPQLQARLPDAMSPIPAHCRVAEALDAPSGAEAKKLETPQDKAMRDPHPLAWHPDADIRELAAEISALREELYAPAGSGGSLGPMWPQNVTYANFLDFQLVPTLVYHLQYPRTNRVRALYVLERALATFGTFLVIYVITVNWIMPVTVTANTSLVAVFIELAPPMMLCYLLIFYLMFECVCNGFAELTRFADREFYQDWWNSSSMEEFARKWNRPVHHFLLQHVYVSMRMHLGMSRHSASLFTFFISSVLHELVMAIISGKIRGYLFFAQMFQYPLILLARTPLIKQNPTLGNAMFWTGLMVGFPMLNVAYLPAMSSATVQAQAKAFAAIPGEIQGSVAELRPLVHRFTKSLESQDLHFPDGLSLLTVKIDALLAYVHHLALVGAHRLSGKSLADETGCQYVQALVKLRLLLEKMRPIETRLKYQIEKLVRAAAFAEHDAPAAGAAAGADDDELDALAFRPNPEGLAAPAAARAGDQDDGEPEEDAVGTYRPPKIAPVMYDPDARPSRSAQNKERQPSRNAALLADLSAGMSSNPYETSSGGVGAGAAIGSAGSSRARALRRMQEFEEDNYKRLSMNKRDAKRRRRDEQDVALGGLGLSSEGNRLGGGVEEELGDLLRGAERDSRRKQHGGSSDAYELLQSRAAKRPTTAAKARDHTAEDMAKDAAAPARNFKKGLRAQKRRARG
ncbi:sterol O-acyltransferase [Malassezia sp. CBS 17886]|nr:sterol O-acyltransferase [Malassezia sp. CBS 17886]